MTEPKNYFIQRIPGFIDPRGMVSQSFEFTDTQEFLENSYIKYWSDDDATIMKSENRIIVKKSSGRHRLIGWVRSPDSVNLPVVNEDVE
jgi:hypothetical protein